MNGHWIAIILLVPAATVGCAIPPRQPMPALKGAISLRVAQPPPRFADVVKAGVYRIPETSIYVYGHQSDWALLTIFLGDLGMRLADEAARGTARKKVGDSANLRIDVAADTERVFIEERERRRDVLHFAALDGHADATLEVIPYIVLMSAGEERIRPWVVLKTLLKNVSGEEQWKTRYIASLDDPRLLAGDNGWKSNGGEPLRRAVERALRACIDVMFREAAGQLPRGEGDMARVKGNWLWFKDPMELPAAILERTGEVLVVRPDIFGNLPSGGIYIVDPTRGLYGQEKSRGR